MDNKNSLLTPEQAASMLCVATETLNVWRCTRRVKLPYIKVGRLVRYRQSDIADFIDANALT